ncbi:hypothetical protein JOL62DRAFT_53538 [Phyllosticta paracitricarpa]|uniref:Uncharacterized protein n=1 Tax=Phyllosticta paracitricarpa TaxID=2016321 RepID=A0ABR1N9S3_9PEZI
MGAVKKGQRHLSRRNNWWPPGWERQGGAAWPRVNQQEAAPLTSLKQVQKHAGRLQQGTKHDRSCLRRWAHKGVTTQKSKVLQSASERGPGRSCACGVWRDCQRPRARGVGQAGPREGGQGGRGHRGGGGGGGGCSSGPEATSHYLHTYDGNNIKHLGSQGRSSRTTLCMYMMYSQELELMTGAMAAALPVRPPARCSLARLTYSLAPSPSPSPSPRH